MAASKKRKSRKPSRKPRKITKKVVRKIAGKKPEKKTVRKPEKKTGPGGITRPAFAPVSTPARSRRFGLALNINFGEAGESCLWNCIYCPWHHEKPGKAGSTKARLASARPPVASYLSALEKVLKKEPKVETIILGGSSEPTLYPALGELITEILKLKKDAKVKWRLIALSNAAGILNPGMREALESLDQVWIKLDCAEDPLFMKTMRPKKGAPGFKTHLKAVQSLKDVRVQTALWKFPGKDGFQNWSADNLRDLLDLYEKIRPAEIHLTTLKRNENFAAVQPVTFEELESFAIRVAELGIPTEVFP